MKRRSTKDDHSLVAVTWLDPQSDVGWFSVEAVNEMKPAVINSIGFMVRDSKGCIAITTSICETGDVADPLIIPKKLILNIKKVRIT